MNHPSHSQQVTPKLIKHHFQNALHWAENQARSGNRRQALKVANHVLSYDNPPPVAWYIKGKALANHGKRQAALQCYNRALQLHPEWWKEEVLMEGKYALERDLKDYVAVHQTLDSLIKYQTEKQDYYYGLKAFIYRLEDKHEAAIKVLDQVIAKWPDKGEYYTDRGNSKKNLDLYPQAIADYQAGIARGISDSVRYQDRIDDCKRAIAYQQRWQKKVDSYQPAIKALTTQIKQAPHHPRYYMRRAEQYNNAGISDMTSNNKTWYAKALQDYNQALRLDLSLLSEYKRQELLKEKAKCLKELDRFEEALTTINLALQQKSAHDAQLYVRYTIYEDMKAYPQALADIEALIQKEGPEGLLYWGYREDRANTLFAMGNYQAALTEYQAVGKKLTLQFPERVRICQVKLGLVYDYKAELKRIDQHLYHRNFDTTLALVDDLLKVRPNSPEAYYYRAKAYEGLDLYAKALATYQQILDMAPHYGAQGDFLMEKGELEEKLDKPHQALATYEQAAKYLPHQKHYLAYKAMGKIYMKQKDYHNAFVNYGVAYSRVDHDDQFHRSMFAGDLAFACIYLRNYQVALGHSQRAYEHNKAWGKDIKAACEALVAQVDTIGQLTEALKTARTDAEKDSLLVERGDVYYEIQHYDDALADYNAAAKLNPARLQELEFTYDWALIANEAKAYKTAYEVNQKGLKQWANDWDFVSLHADICLALKRYKECVEYSSRLIKDCISLWWDYEETFVVRARAYIGLKKYALAYKDLKAYLEYLPHKEEKVAKELKLCKEKLGAKE